MTAERVATKYSFPSTGVRNIRRHELVTQEIIETWSPITGLSPVGFRSSPDTSAYESNITHPVPSRILATSSTTRGIVPFTSKDGRCLIRCLKPIRHRSRWGLPDVFSTLSARQHQSSRRPHHRPSYPHCLATTTSTRVDHRREALSRYGEPFASLVILQMQCSPLRHATNTFSTQQVLATTDLITTIRSRTES